MKHILDPKNEISDVYSRMNFVAIVFKLAGTLVVMNGACEHVTV